MTDSKETERDANDKNEEEVEIPPYPTIEEWAAKVASQKPKPALIKDILPSQRGEYIAIAGRTGLGKTNLVLKLAFCLATGTPFYGFKCREVPVLLIEFEGDRANFLERYNKIKANFPKTEGNLRFSFSTLSNPEKMQNKIFKKAEGSKVLILDPVKFIVPGDYLKPRDAGIFVREFKQRLAEHKMSAIVTLPIKKPNEKSLIHPSDVYQMKGATEYADAATTVILIEKRSHSKSKEVILYFAKHRIASHELGRLNLRLNREKCMFDVVKKQEEEAEESDTEENDDEFDMQTPKFKKYKNTK